MDIKIIVATHKRYRMPQGKIYCPIQAGKHGKEDIGYTGDDTGDNISNRNWYYSELSAIYWAWKNFEFEALGVCHYRRHFTMAGHLRECISGKWNCILTDEEAQMLMAENDIIVAAKRWYLIETNESHYAHAHAPEELRLMRQIISERCPEYLEAYDEMQRRRWAHMFSMFIMKRQKLDEFCTWWFDLLFEFERRVDMTNYPPKERRAYIDERLMDVWLIKNGYPYREIRVMYMERQNWPAKIFAMVKRKFERKTIN